MPSYFSTNFTLHEETAIPSGISRAQVLAALHDHEFMIKRNCRVLSFRLLPAGDKNAHIEADSGTGTYEVTDKMTFLPEKIWPASSVTYTMSFVDTPDGLKHILKAAMGMVSKATHTIEERDSGMVLTEDSDVEVNRLVAGAVKRNMHETYAGNMKAFVDGLGSREMNAKVAEE
ncbi:hypothetical protein MMC13_001567 [Lambiella insularis]|nr:hypothetical protein [Lambiella insularis]